MNVNYEYYRIFYYVAKYENVTQAAEVLQSNQPNVSRIIKLLEHEMGCQLLLRRAFRLSCTWASGLQGLLSLSLAKSHS